MQHAAWPASFWIFAMLAAAALSAVATWFAIGYARRRRLIDEPGIRRSHSEPTPRGGGIGMVIAALVCACLPALARPVSSRFAAPALIGAIAIVAAVGWLDDHRGLPARWRLAAHCLAAIVFLLPVILPLVLVPAAVEMRFSVGAPLVWASLLAVVIAIVWFINLHNFMDGIDGLLAAQAIFVFAALALLCSFASEPHAGQIAVFAAAVVGFLPFNFPRARIFMGDVGSGTLGLLIAIAVLWQMSAPRIAIASGILLCSAFVTDATCTLVSRILRGRRWYSAHREHLYQWLARSGFRHSGVVAIYMAWNLVVVVPVVAWINRTAESPMSIDSAGTEWTATAAVYASGVIVWCFGKRVCLDRARRRSRHAAA